MSGKISDKYFKFNLPFSIAAFSSFRHRKAIFNKQKEREKRKCKNVQFPGQYCNIMYHCTKSVWKRRRNLSLIFLTKCGLK